MADEQERGQAGKAVRRLIQLYALSRLQQRPLARLRLSQVGYVCAFFVGSLNVTVWLESTEVPLRAVNLTASLRCVLSRL